MDGKLEKTEKSESTFIPLLQDEKSIETKSKQAVSFRNTNYRYLFLLFACLLRFGRNYCYDNPQALQDQFQDKNGDFKLSGVDYNLLNGVYSFPNIILPLCGGIISDKLGGRLGVLIFSFFLIIGQFFFLIGAQFSAFWLLIFGRVIFGLGGETLCVVQNTIVASWFGEKELGFAFGMDILVARLGGTLNSWLTPYLFNISSSFFIPLFTGLLLCVCSFFCGLAMFYMDRESDVREGVVVQRTNQSEIPANPMELRDVRKFDGRFRMLVFNCMMVYGAFFCFTGNANSILCSFFGMENDTAGLILIVFYLSSACATPGFGLVADKIGKRSFSIIISGIIYIVAIFLLLYIPKDSSYGLILLPMILIGIFYSWYASSFFPCIPLIVEKNMVGTAFGLVVSFENLNLSIAPLIFGSIHDHSEGIGHGYFWPLIYVIGQMGLALLSAMIVYLIDRKKNNVLQLGMNEAKNFIKN